MAERLRTLKGGASVRAFAERVGLAPSLVSNYLNGTRLPESPTLRTIAERTGASLDWLLLGEGGPEPRYRGESRTPTDLEADVAAHVRRALGAPDIPEDVIAAWYCLAGELSREVLTHDAGDAGEQLAALLGVDGGAILRRAVNQAREDRGRLLIRHYDFARVAAAALPLGRAYFVQILGRLARLLAPMLPGTADALNRCVGDATLEDVATRLLAIAPSAVAELRAYQAASKRGEVQFSQCTGERPAEWDMRLDALFRPDAAIGAALQLLFQQVLAAISANQERAEGVITWTAVSPPEPGPIARLGAGLSAALDVTLERLEREAVGAR